MKDSALAGIALAPRLATPVAHLRFVVQMGPLSGLSGDQPPQAEGAGIAAPLMG